MSSLTPRTNTSIVKVEVPNQIIDGEQGKTPGIQFVETFGTRTSKLWRSEGHPINRKTGKYESGGPFHVTHTGAFVNPSHVDSACSSISGGKDCFYSGPVFGDQYLGPLYNSYSGAVSDWDESSLNSDGATAIAQCAPTNPTAELATTLAESVREGIPSLPGIQSWKKRTEMAQAAGSEYLNYQFGWAPLVSEVHSVVNAARHHRDIMQNYRHNEGKNVHRRFDFPSESSRREEEIPPAWALSGMNAGFIGPGKTAPQRTISLVRERHRWFEGCFTYGGPSGTDSFRRSLGYGSEADAVYGLSLTPDVLWNLTPWSWAVDWFSNTGDVIHNITNFALAGLVMRYGYMMEESIEEYSVNYASEYLRVRTGPKKYGSVKIDPSSRGYRKVTKSRCPANPFGFGVGWEGLSPTQLAITAAIGITRFL